MTQPDPDRLDTSRLETPRLDAAASALRDSGAWNDAQLAIVLGSGLKSFACQIEDAVSLPFDEVPHWPAPRVEGHGGSVVFGTVEGLPVACLAGRVHLYEGWTPAEAVRAVRTLRRLGAPRFLMTNAAGGIADVFDAGDLMVLRDHLNMTGMSPLRGDAEPVLGPRFPDQSTVYDPDLRAALRSIDAEMHEGVYAGMLGPSYETPAEVQMLRTLGAHAVGMSTVHEAIALNAMGAKVAAISLISNLAAGISLEPLAHDEVIAAGDAAEQRLTDIVRGLCRQLR